MVTIPIRPQSINRSRLIAQQLLAGSQGTPRTLGDFLSQMGGRVGARLASDRADRREQEFQQERGAALARLLGVGTPDVTGSGASLAATGRDPRAVQTALAAGGGPTPSASTALSAPPAGRPQGGNRQAIIAALLSSDDPTLQQVAVQQALQQDKGFTLGTGQRRFDASGRLVAEGPAAAPRESAFAEKLRLAGVDPTTPEGQERARQLAFKPETVVNVGSKGATKFSETLGTKQAEKFSALQDSADIAQSTRFQLDRIRAALPNIQQGPTAGGRLFVGQLIQGLGLDPAAIGVNPEEITSAQDFTSAVNKITTNYTESLKGSLSERELDFLAAIPPQLANSPEGNAFIVDNLTRANDAVIARADAAADWVAGQEAAGRRVTGSQFANFLRRYDRENPVFTEADRRRLKSLEGQNGQNQQNVGGELSAEDQRELDELRRLQGGG